jgi:hypothetical protein
MENSTVTLFQDQSVATTIVSTLRQSKTYTPNMIDYWLYTINNTSPLGFCERKVLTSMMCRDNWIIESRPLFQSGVSVKGCMSTHWDEYLFERGFKTLEMFEKCAKVGEYAR